MVWVWSIRYLEKHFIGAGAMHIGVCNGDLDTSVRYYEQLFAFFALQIFPFRILPRQVSTGPQRVWAVSEHRSVALRRSKAMAC